MGLKNKVEPLTPKQKAYFKLYTPLAIKAAQVNLRRYGSIGCLTYEDLLQEAYVGLCTVVRSPKIETHNNPKAYVASFCSGYITHLIHRKSRMVMLPYKCMKAGESSYHIESSLIPEVAVVIEEPEEKAYDPRLTDFLESLSDNEYRNFLKTGRIGKAHAAKFQKLKEEFLNEQ